MSVDDDDDDTTLWSSYSDRTSCMSYYFCCGIRTEALLSHLRSRKLTVANISVMIHDDMGIVMYSMWSV